MPGLHRAAKGGSMSAVRLEEAARALGVSTASLRRWIDKGCPVARRGARGRGRAALVDPEQVRTWRDGGTDAAMLCFASRLPELLAGAVSEAHRLADGVDKRRLAGVLAATWYICTTRLLDDLRAAGVDVAEVERLPLEVEMLRKIASK